MHAVSVFRHDIDNLKSFCLSQGWRTTWTDDLLTMFFGQLASSTEMIFDIHQDGKRVAVGTLLDKTTNKMHHANLEILAVSDTVDERLAVDIMMDRAKQKLPANSNQFRVYFDEDFIASSGVVQWHGLEYFYDTHEMQRSDMLPEIPHMWNIQFATPQDDAALYACLVDSFSDNVDINYPSYQDWVAARHRMRPVTWVIKEKDTVLAFLNLVASNGVAVIRSLGVLRHMRNQGVATALLTRAVNFAAENDIETVLLHVTAQNETALKLYTSLGFETTKRSTSYLWKRP